MKGYGEWVSLVLPIFLASCLGGCTADTVDKWAANSTALAKEQTTIILDDNAAQTDTITEQFAAISPENAEAVRALMAGYAAENEALKEQVAGMHHELTKVTDKLGTVLNAGLGFLGLGGAGAVGAAGMAMGKKKGTTNA